MLPERHTANVCVEYSATIEGGRDGCERVFHEVLAREYSDAAFAAVHLLTVDAFVLQHPEKHGPRSNAFHLLRLLWIVEHDGNPVIGKIEPRIQEALKNYRDFPYLEPPSDQGALTIQYLHAASTAEEHSKRAWEYGRTVCDAWNSHHDWAREQLAG